MINKINEFLIKHNSHVSQIEEDEFINNFISEMELGLASKSSLGMIPSYIYNFENNITNSKEYIILDAGGTNLRGCIGYIKDSKPIFKNIKTCKMFGVTKSINKKDFYDGFYKFIKSIYKKDLDIGCCFSFTCEPNKELDGKILSFSKKVKTKGVVNSCFGQELKSKFSNGIDITVINDAISTNLGSQFNFNKNVNYLSYIWGTGINVSYYENVSNIKKKYKNKKRGKELINIESCCFDKFELSDFENELIKKTGRVDILEKTSGGVYLASIFNNAINGAYKEKLINLTKKINLSLVEYSNLLTKKLSIFKDDYSYEFAKLLIIELIKRSAKLNALVLVSIILKINNKEPYYITLEGSTINNLPHLKEYFIKYVNKRLSNYKIKFLTGDNLNFKGALLVAAHHNK